MKTKRGDVVLVLFPNSDLHTAKRRPALVIQRDELSGGLAQTIVAMISSNLARRGHASRVFVGRDSVEGKAAGLRLDSVIMTDNLATILESEIDALLGLLPNQVSRFLVQIQDSEGSVSRPGEISSVDRELKGQGIGHTDQKGICGRLSSRHFPKNLQCVGSVEFKHKYLSSFLWSQDHLRSRCKIVLSPF